MRVTVLVPTTGGTALVCALEEKPRLQRCKVTGVGDFRAFPIEKDYHRLVEGALSALGDTSGNWHLSLSDRVETGRSWELPILLAHRAVRHGAVLTGEVEEADLVVFATGSVDSALDPAGEVHFVPEKLALAAPVLARVRPGATALFVLGAGGAASDVAAAEEAAARLPGARAVVAERFADLESVLLSALGADATAGAWREDGPGLSPGDGRLKTAALGLAAAALVAAIGFGLSILFGDAFRSRGDVLSMLALERLVAADRNACIEANMNGNPLEARPLTVSPDGVSVPATPVTCALRFRNVGLEPFEIALDQGFAGLLIPGVSPLQRRLAIVNGTRYDLVFNLPPIGRTSVLTVFGPGGEEERIAIRFEPSGDAR